MERAYFYTVTCGPKFSATSASRIELTDRELETWTVLETSSVTPGEDIIVAGFTASVPDNAASVVKISQNGSDPEGFFFLTDDSLAVGSAVVVRTLQNFLNISVSRIPAEPVV